MEGAGCGFIILLPYILFRDWWTRSAVVSGEYVVINSSNGEYAYHGEGWAFTRDIGLAKHFASYEDAVKAKEEILSGGEFDLAIVQDNPKGNP